MTVEYVLITPRAVDYLADIRYKVMMETSMHDISMTNEQDNIIQSVLSSQP